MTERIKSTEDLCIVGGAGHVGLPLAITFAQKGLRVLIQDLNPKAIETIRLGKMPFVEHGAEPALKEVLKSGRLTFASDPSALARAENIIVTIGTPVDRYLSPHTKAFKTWADECLPYLRDGQLIVLRSTVYPGTTEWLDHYLRKNGKNIHIAYCPERIVQGHAMKELLELPQLVGGLSPTAQDAAEKLFLKIAPEVVPLSPREAEFAKLFTNAYRYIQFAAANQFFMIARNAGVDYGRILGALKKDYARARDIPGAGFAAGPCLLKDTMQLAACAQNQFTLGSAALMINEGLILYLVEDLRRQYPIDEMKIGLLGMAFKADNDDTRSSLSYKLKKTLLLQAKAVLTTDPHVTTDPELLPLEKVVRESDLLILCVPHSAYRKLDLKGKKVLDIWNFWSS